MDTKTKIARVFSEILNGFFSMISSVILATWISELDLKYKIGITLYYAITGIIPFFILKSLGKVSDYEFTERKERYPYFITISIFFILGYFLINTLNQPQLSAVAASLAATTTILTIVTFFWKMSGHMTHGVYALMSIIFLFPDVKYLWLILLYIPLLAWSRVQLKKHTYAQTVAGTVVSLVVTILFYYILW